MTALVARSFGRIVMPFSAVLSVLAAFQVALIAVAASLAADGEFDRLTQVVPSAFRAALAPALTSFGNMTTFGYFDAIIVFIVVQWAIYVASEPAGDIEAGLVDLVLARPLPRHWLVTRSLVVTFGSILMVTAAMGVGTLIGLSLLAPSNATWPEGRLIVTMMVHLTAVAWCFGAAALAAAAWVRRRATAIAIVTMAAMVAYLIDLLGLWWQPIRSVAQASPFNYFHGGALVAGTSDPVRNLTVLGIMTLTSIVVAYWTFSRRDL